MKTRLERAYIRARRACKKLNPVPGFPVTYPWGVKNPIYAAGHHTGDDHACPVGTPVVAVTWGEVIGTGFSALGWGQDYGNMVIVRQGSKTHDYAFCHLSEVKVHVGQRIVPGQVLGLSGQTGNVTGPHCHFEVRPAGGRYGSDVNPIVVEKRVKAT